MKNNKRYLLGGIFIVMICFVVYTKHNLIIEKKDLNSILEENYQSLKSIENENENVKYVTPYDFGAVGDGVTDDSDAFKKMFEYNNIYIPEGAFLLKCDNKDPSWLDVGGNFMTNGYFNIKSNTTIICSDKSLIKVKASDYKAYNVITIKGVENVKILGMNILGDREEHIGNDGEFGFGIFIADSKNILIMNSKFSNMWGDGININTTNTNYKNNEIFIKGCIFENNRRQGISIESCDGAIIEDCVFNNTNGTLPESGVDIEPSHKSMYVKNIVFNNCEFNNNRIGLLIDGQFGKVSEVEVNNCTFYENREKAQIYITKAKNIKVNNYNGIEDSITVNEDESSIFVNSSSNIEVNGEKVKLNIISDIIKNIINKF